MMIEGSSFLNMDNYIKIIRESGLIHASSRKLPLISASCIFFGYNKLLKEMVGYSYGTIGNMGKRDRAYFLINEDKTGKLFKKKIKIVALAKLNDKFKVQFKKSKFFITKEKKEKNFFKTMATVLEIYPKVLCQIGFYNSIMRYVKDNRGRAREIGELADSIAKDKDAVANLIYPEIEPLIIKCVKKIGESLGFDGDLLRYLTLREFKEFLKTKKISKIKLLELKKRRTDYFYLYYKNKDIIITNKKYIDEIRGCFLANNPKISIIKGVVAYPGKVTGLVYKSFHGIKNVKSGQILVTSITRPQDTQLLNKFSAIVTDEGGVLSHVAVIAREFKIPAVMSTKIATQVLRNGDFIEVDANKGIIKIIKKAN